MERRGFLKRLTGALAAAVAAPSVLKAERDREAVKTIGIGQESAYGKDIPPPDAFFEEGEPITAEKMNRFMESRSACVTSSDTVIAGNLSLRNQHEVIVAVAERTGVTAEQAAEAMTQLAKAKLL